MKSEKVFIGEPSVERLVNGRYEMRCQNYYSNKVANDVITDSEPLGLRIEVVEVESNKAILTEDYTWRTNDERRHIIEGIRRQIQSGDFPPSR